MKKTVNYFKIILTLLFAVLLSCRHRDYSNDPQLNRALALAGNNRAELEKALDHYSAPEDSLKYKAAVFLIKYMPGKYGKVFPEYNTYQSLFDTLQALNTAYEKASKNYEFYKHYKRTVFNYFMAEHHLKNTADVDFEIKPDIETITAGYLIENIDYAFKAWDMPWNKKLSFANFCEFILPYRYGNEELQPWRKAYYESNKYLLDSLKDVQDPVKAALFLKQRGYISISEITELRGLGNAIKPLDLIRINTTTNCKDETGAILLRLRGLGVPVARLTIPIWGNRGDGHDINGVLAAGGKWMGFGGGVGTDAYKPPVFPTKFRPTKYYAELYSSNPASDALVKKDGRYQTDSGYVDVTRFIMNTVDLTLPYPGVKNGTKACLSVFNNAAWVPLVQATVHNGSAAFPQIGNRIIYMAGTINGGQVQLKGNPFLLDSIGVVRPIVPSKINKTITLLRKYPHNELLESFIPTLNGCYFEGSNDISFVHAVTLWKIDKLTGLHTLEKQLKNARYQYVRLVFPQIDRKNEELGGIQFYTEDNTGKKLLTGEPICSTPASKTFYSHVFDNDPSIFIQLLNQKFADFKQYYDGENLVIPDKQLFWIGLKFKDKMNITSIGFSPRTDDNDVNAGETYKLFYWNDGGWATAGQKKATANKITFTAPANALYVLKDMDKGKEQRIFLYQDNKQVWY